MPDDAGVTSDGALTTATHSSKKRPLGQNSLMGIEVVQDRNQGTDLRIASPDFKRDGPLPHRRQEFFRL